MAVTLPPQLFIASVAGLVVGVGLLVRGMQGYRRAARIGDIATSHIASLAAGEVRISGVVEAAELLLVSPLQSADCVYYHVRIGETQHEGSRTVLDEERAVGFSIRDGTGTMRVFPRGAAWDVQPRLDDRDGALGDAPPGLFMRTGPAVRAANPDRETQIAQLLGRAGGRLIAAGDVSGTVGSVASVGLPATSAVDDGYAPDARAEAPQFALDRLVMMQSSGGYGHGSRHYVESRLEPGETITIVGSAVPFAALDDPDEADVAYGADDLAPGELDPEVAADLAAARAAGTLAPDPEAAWGNAAIPGFGIGQPVRPPTLDPGIPAPRIATPAQARTFERRFEIAPETLVIASGPESPLLVSEGAPAQAEARAEGRFLVGLAGALLAIVSAVAIAIQVGGGAG